MQPALPEPYQSWWIAVVGEPPPIERSADCANCPMCARGGFLANVKCCGYVPALPNFRAGAALKAGGEARVYVERRVATGRPTDTWLLPTEEEEALYDQTRMRFGQTDQIRCAYVTERGTCAVWRYRNATCATWFCQHDAGEVGGALWDAAQELFLFAEGLVAVWAGGDGYEKAAERAETLDWAAIRKMGGRDLRVLERNLVAAWRALETVPTVRETGRPPGPREESR